MTVQGAKPEAIAGGTSGSPIIVDGRAVGVMSCGEDLNPVLMNDLPGWLLAELEQAATRELKTTWSKNELSAALRLAKEEDLS